MTQKEYNRNRYSATGYMANNKDNRKDKKTQDAYKRFKTPPWYLKSKKDEKQD